EVQEADLRVHLRSVGAARQADGPCRCDHLRRQGDARGEGGRLRGGRHRGLGYAGRDGGPGQSAGVMRSADAPPRPGGPAFERVRARLLTEGRLTFAAFMAEALYGPEGYYACRPRLGGADADFFTSPELHPAFGALLGELARKVWAALDYPDPFEIVEYGPG